MNRRFWMAAAAALVCVSSLPAEEPLKVGDEAPDFEMKGTDGKTYKLSEFKGKQAVVVAWYPRAFTGGCTKECTSFREDGAKLRAYNAAYFTASCDPLEKNKAFAESLKLDYPILSDPDGAVAKRYGIYNAERKAAQRWTFIVGADGKIQAIDKKVQTVSHGADIAEKLKALGVEPK